MAAMSDDQMKMMAAVISETLQQIHEARIVPGAPTFMAEDSEMKDLMKSLAKQMQGKGGGGGHRAVLDERNFRRLEKFTKSQTGKLGRRMWRWRSQQCTGRRRS